jgi:PAS domain S-box-containing protein
VFLFLVKVMCLLELEIGLLGAFTDVTTAIALLPLAAMLTLVERRGRDEPLNPHRQVEIDSLLHSVPDPVFVFDRKGIVTGVNRPAELLCRKKAQELLGRSDTDLGRLLSRERSGGQPESVFGVAEALSRGQQISVRRSFHSPHDNVPVELVITANPVRDHGGAVHGALVIARDVTELNQLQRKFADAERHHAIGQMAAGLAHDFGNVLDTIEQAAYVLEKGPERPKDERQKLVGMIHNGVKRGSEIISRVREYLVGNGTRSDRVQMNYVLEEAVELTRPLWQAQRISVVRRFEPAMAVCANAGDLRRVFTNLVVNALEAMPHGGTLTVGCSQSDRKVLAYVQDTGEGIPSEAQPKIFSAYYTTKPEGTGLGLAGAKNTLTSHGGDIGFATSREGTRFTIELPAYEEGK